MSEDLQPGDMCVIVDRFKCEFQRACQGHMIGKTVLLLRLAPVIPEMEPADRPYWEASGMQPYQSISHVMLKKIPPAPIETDTRLAESV
jgi:hypothetical protein